MMHLEAKSLKSVVFILSENIYTVIVLLLKDIHLIAIAKTIAEF